MCLNSTYLIKFNLDKVEICSEFIFKGYDFNFLSVFKHISSGIEFHISDDRYEIISSN